MVTAGPNEIRRVAHERQALNLSEEPAKRERQIAELATEARSLAKRIVRPFLKSHPAITADDAEDVASTVSLRLLAKLRTLPRPEAKDYDFNNYVATLTFNAVNDHLRSRFPNRTRLVNQLRYMLTRDARLALWSASDDTAVCGLAEWRGKPAVGRPIPQVDAAGPPVEALVNFFRQYQSPITFEALVDCLAAAWQITDDIRPEARPVAEPDISAIETRETLSHLWNEVVELRAPQRKALLLSLRDEDGSSALNLLVFTGVASIEAIANALELRPAELMAIWHELPLDDSRIASMVGGTRQQVINSRRSARQRLQRRLYQTTLRRAAEVVSSQQAGMPGRSPDPTAALQASAGTASEGRHVAESDLLAADNYAMRLESLLREAFAFREIDRGFALVVNALLTALRYRDKLLNSRQWNTMADILERLKTSPHIGEDKAVQSLLDLENAGLRISPPELELVADMGRGTHRRS